MHHVLSTPIAFASRAFVPSSATPVKASMLDPDGRLAKEGNAPRRKWFHVASVAAETRNGYSLSREFLELYVRSFYAKPEGGPVFLGHVDAERPLWMEEPPARGWVLALELTDTGDLWALYELTDDLARSIASGNYKYNSIYGAVTLDDDGREVGAEFISIAVTNFPAVAGLTAMAASSRRRMEIEMSIKEILKAAIKELPDDASDEAVLQYIRGRLAQEAAINGGASKPAEEKAAASRKVALTEGDGATAPVQQSDVVAGEVKAEEAAPGMDLGAALAAAGIDPEALLALVQGNPQALLSLLNGGAEAPPAGADDSADRTEQFGTRVKEAVQLRTEAMAKQLSSTSAELKAATARIAAMELDVARRRVDDAITKGLVLETRREKLYKLAADNREALDAVLDDAAESPAVPTGKLVTQRKATATGLDDVNDEEYAYYERALARIEKDPEKRKKLIQERIAKRRGREARA